MHTSKRKCFKWAKFKRKLGPETKEGKLCHLPCVNPINLLWNKQIAIYLHTYKAELYSHFQPSLPIRGGLTSAIQSPCAALQDTASTRGAEGWGHAENHICLDKNRSIPRNQIQRQREIPNKVVQYADHTATEAAAASLLPSNCSVSQHRGECGVTIDHT